MAEQYNMDTYDCAVPFDDIPKSDVVDEGMYTLRVREMKTTQSQEGKLMITAFFTIDEGPMAGVPFPIQNYVIGTDEDPMAHDPKTWSKSFGSRQFNQLLEACRSPKLTNSLRQTLLRAQQARFHVYVTKNIQSKGDYKGQEQNRIARYGPYGEQMIVPGRSHASSPNGTGPSGAFEPRGRMRPNTESQPAAVEQPNENDDISY